MTAHTDHPLRHYDRTCPACNPADHHPRCDAAVRQTLAEHGHIGPETRTMTLLARELEQECERLRAQIEALTGRPPAQGYLNLGVCGCYSKGTHGRPETHHEFKCAAHAAHMEAAP